MATVKNPWFISLILALVFGVLIGSGLYFFSDKFFKTKRLQTVVRSAELGRSADSSDVVLSSGQKTPNLVFKEMTSNKEYSLYLDKSPLKIINFWASWCEPCVEEFSSFSRLIKSLKGKASFIGISEDHSLEEASEFLKAFTQDFSGLENVYFSYDENKRFSKEYGILALPETFIISKDGKLLKRVSGFEQWDKDHVVKFFEQLLEAQGVKL